VSRGLKGFKVSTINSQSASQSINQLNKAKAFQPSIKQKSTTQSPFFQTQQLILVDPFEDCHQDPSSDYKFIPGIPTEHYLGCLYTLFIE